MASEDWQFVVSSGPKVPRDPAIRTMIRKQAMKDVAIARKRKGNPSRVELRRQLEHPSSNASKSEQTTPCIRSTDSSSLASNESPVSSSNSDESSGGVGLELVLSNDDSDILADTTGMQPYREWLSVPQSMPLTAFEALRATYAVDITELSTLTGFSIGKGTFATLAAEPWRLLSLMGLPQYSYLQFIPSRFGNNPTLNAAVECVTAGVYNKLSPQNPVLQRTVMHLYSKALREVQAAIVDEQKCLDADVLCAVELLSLHELVDASRVSAWENHIRGCERLVRYRSPSSFKTEFEKALFLGHVGPIVTESLMTGVVCYLDSPEWTALWTSMIDRTTPILNERSELAISLRAHVCSLPGLAAAITEVVSGPELFNPVVMKQLARKARRAAAKFKEWDEDYKAYCVRASFSRPSESELSLRRQLFGSAMECLTVQKRMLATVCENERLSLEVEVQTLAKLIANMQEGLPKHSWLFVGYELSVAHLVTVTKDDWVEDMTGCTDKDKLLATRKRYLHMMAVMQSSTHG